MNLTKHMFYTFAFCLLLSALEFWSLFSYMTIDDGLFDYRTNGNFWLRTSIADFFIGFGEWFSSPQLYELIINEFVKKPIAVATVILLGLSISAITIYYGFSTKKGIFLILGAVIWFLISLLWLFSFQLN